MKILNSNIEIRNKSEIRMFETLKFRTFDIVSYFGFRISDL